MSANRLQSCNTLNAGIDLLAVNCSADQTHSMDIDAMIAVTWTARMEMDDSNTMTYVGVPQVALCYLAQGIAGKDCEADAGAEQQAFRKGPVAGLPGPSRRA